MSADADGSVMHWNYGKPGRVVIQEPNVESGRITRVRFDDAGCRFGTSDASGGVRLWNFDADHCLHNPYFNICAHSKASHDLSWLDHKHIFATGGLSLNSQNVCLWDVRCHPSRSRVQAFVVHEAGCHTLVYCSQRQLLFSGGKRGDICVIDMRNRSIQTTIQAHDLNVKALLIDEPSGCLISGSTDGDIKFWSMETFKCVDIWRGVHEKNWFLRATLDRTPVSTYGVMGLEANGDWIYSCGADGVVRRRKRPLAFPEEAGGNDINIVHL